MIKIIDSKSLCGHLKALLGGVINDDDLQAAIGQLTQLDPDHFCEVVKEIATIFTGAFLGNYDIPKELTPHIPMASNLARYEDRHGNSVYGNAYKDKWINDCLHLPGNEVQTQKIWAGLTNLKSAAVIKTLSRSEKDAQYEAFRHTVTIDPDFLSEWEKFVDEFTPFLTEKLQISDEREYDTLWSTPLEPSKHSVTMNDKGGFVTCLRGSDEYADPTCQLKHPAINRIARRHPKEFAEAVFLGFTTDDEPVFPVPDPFPDELPVGKCAVAPKRAQKMRVVWIPIAMLDSMSRPIFHKLEEIERKWNLQAVFSHDEARELIRQKLIDNQCLSVPRKFCSYDQSSFTDNFSYDFVQRPILKALLQNNIITEYDLDVVDSINHGTWDLKALGRKYEREAFGTGTGMGTPPSFALASIGNAYLVAYSYWKEHHKFPYPKGPQNVGLVVGDDCELFDARYAVHYERACATIGLSINMDKSFQSDNTAEFCGKIITPQGVFDKHKLIDFTSLDGLRDLVKYYGRSAESYFREWEDVLGPSLLNTVRRIQEIPAPYGTKEFEYHTTPVCELPPVEMVANLQNEVSQIQSILTDNHINKDDILEIMKRKAKIPEISHKGQPTRVDEPSDRRDLPMLAVALAQNAVEVFKTSTDQSLDKLYRAAEFVNAVYTALTDFDPDIFTTYRDNPSTLIPKRIGKGKESAVEKIVRLSQTGKSSDNVKGGTDYELK